MTLRPPSGLQGHMWIAIDLYAKFSDDAEISVGKAMNGAKLSRFQFAEKNSSLKINVSLS